MKTEIKEVYKCEFCNKLYQVKRFAEAHEKQCSKNTSNYRICFGCEFLGKKRTHIMEDNEYRSYEVPLDLLYCSKINVFLYPPKVEHKGNQFELGDDYNEPMRVDCEHWKDENDA